MLSQVVYVLLNKKGNIYGMSAEAIIMLNFLQSVLMFLLRVFKQVSPLFESNLDLNEKYHNFFLVCAYGLLVSG